MIVKSATYFKKDIYLPHAKVGATDAVTDVEIRLDDFIDEYEQDCLEKCFGSRLYLEFTNNLDDTEPTFITSGADAKWGYLLNGQSYTNSNGEAVVWKGIRQKTVSLGSSDEGVYDASFLAQYIYFFHESNASITRSNAGNVRSKSANAERVSPTPKAVKAWRKFVKLVQGEMLENPYFYKNSSIGLGGCAVDYYATTENSNISLYQFIADQNDLVEDTYENFEPKAWGNMNNLGI